jgi:hypothetical protein
MWKANRKTLFPSLDSLFPKTEIYARCFLWRQNNPEVNYSPIRISARGGGVSRVNIMQRVLQGEGLQRKEEGTSQLQHWNVEC